jgi:hypothetical protein
MHKLLTHLLAAKARRLRDAYAKLLYCTVSRIDFYKTLGENRLDSFEATVLSEISVTPSVFAHTHIPV